LDGPQRFMLIFTDATAYKRDTTLSLRLYAGGLPVCMGKKKKGKHKGKKKFHDISPTIEQEGFDMRCPRST
jgi:hypothetical protein